MFLTKLWEMSPEDRTKLFAAVKSIKTQHYQANQRNTVISKKHNLVRGNKK